MPRYFFSMSNSSGLTRDEEGQDLPNLDAARVEGLDNIRSMLSSEVRHGRLDLRGRIDIVDEAGTRLLTLRFRDAFELFEADESPAND